MPYWFVDYLGYEKRGSNNNSFENKLKIGLRQSGLNEPKRINLYFNDLVVVSSSGFENFDAFCSTIGVIAGDNIFSRYFFKAIIPDHWHRKSLVDALDILHCDYVFDRNTRGVIQLEVPYDRFLLYRLRSKSKYFNFANIDRVKAFDLPVLGRKVTFSDNLGQIINSKMDLDAVLTEIYFDLLAKGYSHDGSERLIKRFITGKYKGRDISINDSYRLAAALVNVNNLFDGNGEIIIRNNFDISLNSFSDLEFGDFLNAEELSKQVVCFLDIENPLFQRSEAPEVKQIDEKYSDKISWVALSFKMEDGERQEEIHTLRNLGQDVHQGYFVFHYDSEIMLTEGVAASIRDKGTYFLVGQHLPHDIGYLKSVEGAQFIINREVDRKPSFRVSFGEFYRRIFSEGQEVIDTHRAARIFKPHFLYGGGFNLESIMRNLGFDFEKSIDYDEMRALEFLAIGGDINAAREIASYVVADIGPLELIVDKMGLYKRMSAAKNLFPYLSITELIFSQNSAKYYFDFEYWQRNSCQKLSPDEIRDFRLFLDNGKMYFLKDLRKKLSSVISFSKIPDSHNIYYFPIEDFVLNFVFNDNDNLYQKLTQETREVLRPYFRAISNEVLYLYYYYIMQRDNYNLAINISGFTGKNYMDAMRSAGKRFDGDLNNLFNLYESVANLYMAFVNSAKIKPDSGSFNDDVSINQLGLFGQENLFERLDKRYFDLYHLDENRDERLSKGSRNILRAFRMNFTILNKFFDKFNDVVGFMGSDFLLIDLLYIINLRRRMVKTRRKFIDIYQIKPDSYDGTESLEDVLNTAYEELGGLFSKNNFLATNGIYFWSDSFIEDGFLIRCS